MSVATETRFEARYLEDLRARLPISQVVGRTVRLIRKGREFKGLCPFHGEKTPSFYVNDEKHFYHCFGCGANGDIFSWFTEQEGKTFPEAVAAAAELAGVPLDQREAALLPPPDNAGRLEQDAAAKRKSIEKARGLWAGTIRAAGTPVETYLRIARGIDLGVLGGVPPTLRFAMLDYWDTPDGHDKPLHYGRFPAQVAAMQIGPGQAGVCGVHVTYLRPDGLGKVQLHCKVTGQPLDAKKMQGQHKHAAIRFAPVGAVLAVAEGIETALSLKVAGGGGFVPGALPIWAAGSLDNIAGYPARGLRGAPHPERPGKFLRAQVPDPERPGLILPPEVTTVLICEDGDSGDRPLATSIYDLASVRWSQEGRRVLRVRAKPGTDFNDMLKGIA